MEGTHKVAIADCVIDTVVIPKANSASVKVVHISCLGRDREICGWQCKRNWLGSNAVRSKSSVSKNENWRLITHALQELYDRCAVGSGYRRHVIQGRAVGSTCETHSQLVLAARATSYRVGGSGSTHRLHWWSK